MELNHCRSRIGKKSLSKDHVVGIPITSPQQYALFPNKNCLSDPAAQFQIVCSPSTQYSKIRHNRVNSILAKMIKLGQNMDEFAQGLRDHMRIGPKLSEILKGKLRLGARIIQVGGVDKVFRHKFKIGNDDDEKLLNASQCYLFTTGGPIAGLLFVSDKRVAFCSERSIKVSSPNGKLLKYQYKVTIPLRKIKTANESENVEKPTQKYVQIVTEDRFDFWFMGFLNHQRTFKHLQLAIHQAQMRL